MSQNLEVLLEGTYLYYQNDVNFSQENFKVLKGTETPHIHVHAEILSRIETGEFLKIIVKYEMNQHYNPLLMRIEKSLGSKYSEEIFKVDTSNQDLCYTFESEDKKSDFSRPINAKHYLTSPASSTTGLFTLTKKFDATGRTPVILISSNNDWIYEAPPSEKVIYAEYKTREMADFKLNNNQLSASHLCLYEFDSTHTISEEPVELFLSKHYAIPYQLIHGDRKIVIKHLKKNI